MQVPVQADPGGQVYSGREGRLNVDVPRVEVPSIAVDARLDEPEWAGAAVLTDFTQFTPVEGARASQETVARVFYSGDAIYFGVHVYDSEPDRILAHLLERDASQSDDWIRIMLDTFNDDRQAYTFFVSPFGIQSDGMWLESLEPLGGPTGPKVDFNPDFIFESEGRIVDDGWVIEVRIPYVSLRFPEVEEQTWGLQIARGVMRNGYKSSWAPLTIEASSVLAQSGRIRGLRDLHPKRLVEINPVATGKVEGFREGDVFEREGFRPEFGIDGSVGITQNLVLDATINPDFSQVEADVDQIQVNERFALFVPERRAFFLEGIEVFRTSQNLVNTRQIIDPLVGAKTTGKVGPFQVGYLGALDESPTSLFDEEHDALFNLARARADIGAGSTLGFIYTDRTVTDGSAFNRVASADARILFGGRYTVETQLTGSWTREGLGDEAPFAPALTFTFARSGLNFSYRARLIDLSTEFETRTGFMPRTGDTDWGGGFGLNWYGSAGAALESWGFEVQTNNFTRHDDFWSGGAPYEYEIQFMPNVAFRGSRRVNSIFRWGGHRFLPEFYAAHEVVGSDGTPQPYPLPPELKDMLGVAFIPNIRFNDTFNLTGIVMFRTIPLFAEGSRGWENRIGPNLRIQPGERLRLEAGYTWSRMERSEDGTHFSTAHLPRLRVQYQFSRSLLARVIGQYDLEKRSALRHPVTGEAVLINGVLQEERERGNFTGQALLSFEPSPGTIFFIGYSRVMDGPYGFPLDQKDLRQDGFFMKLSYLFRL
jgi:deoxycytidine triphosphate deaminase